MELNQPYRLMKLFSEVLYSKNDHNSILGLEDIDKIIHNLSNEQHPHVAQAILDAILSYYDQILDSLIPYTEQQLMIDSNIIDYTLHSMDLLTSLDSYTNN
ncbi:hypothetical protein H8356DRAFT_1409398 [Neocallimastix lanati (nom. inval.)]|nr:hypothetical protein H8356DRAFT_1409398 [Neocallimastix sp. JGI-2020a]